MTHSATATISFDRDSWSDRPSPSKPLPLQWFKGKQRGFAARVDHNSRRRLQSAVCETESTANSDGCGGLQLQRLSNQSSPATIAIYLTWVPTEGMSFFIDELDKSVINHNVIRITCGSSHEPFPSAFESTLLLLRRRNYEYQVREGRIESPLPVPALGAVPKVLPSRLLRQASRSSSA